MANAALHAAACALLVAHVLLVTVLLCGRGPAPLALQLTYVLGPIAGVWNHGTTSAAARWTDRIAMVVGLGVDLYYVATRLPREGDRAAVACLLALAVLAYASAKCASSSASASALASASASAVRDDDDNNYDDDYDDDGDAAPTTPPTRDITTHLLAHALVLAAHAWLLCALGTA
jgi:hypothetical protein